MIKIFVLNIFLFFSSFSFAKEVTFDGKNLLINEKNKTLQEKLKSSIIKERIFNGNNVPYNEKTKKIQFELKSNNKISFKDIALIKNRNYLLEIENKLLPNEIEQINKLDNNEDKKKFLYKIDRDNINTLSQELFLFSDIDSLTQSINSIDDYQELTNYKYLLKIFRKNENNILSIFDIISLSNSKKNITLNEKNHINFSEILIKDYFCSVSIFNTWLSLNKDIHVKIKINSIISHSLNLNISNCINKTV